MRLLAVLLLGVASLVGSTSVSAQDGAARDTTRSPAESRASKADEIRSIINLPAAAEKARESGVSKEDIRIILDEAGSRKLPPAETGAILQECGAAAKENGPVENFGDYVRSCLNEGLRGKDLAAAIHEEHRRRGKDKGHGDRAGRNKNPSVDNKSAKGDHGDRNEGAKMENDDHDAQGGSREDQRKGKEGKGK